MRTTRRFRAAALVPVLAPLSGLWAAREQAGKWIAVPSSAGPLYTDLAGGLTVTTATSALDVVGAALTVLPPRTVLGRRVVGIRQVSPAGSMSLSQTVYIKTTGAPLPVETVSSLDGESSTVVFGPWGQPPLAVAPNGALPFDSTWSGKVVPGYKLPEIGQR